MRLIGVVTGFVIVSNFFCAVVLADESAELSAYYGFKEMEIIKLDWGIGGLRFADFNGDGRNDIVIINNKKSKIELLIQKESISPGEKKVVVDAEDEDINALNPPSRFERQSVAISQKVYSFVCGDLNSDNLPDLAYYGEPKGLYLILQKDGDAKKAKSEKLSWRTRKKIKIDDGLLTPNMLACADLNNDGSDDLVLASRDAIYVIYQKDSAMSEPVKYPTTAMTRAVEIGDLNGDGINDLILVTNDGEKPLSVRFGLKSGQLGPQQQFFIESPWSLKLENIDDSPGDEVLIVDARSGRLICYKYEDENRSDADWPILFYPLESGQGSTKRDLVAADIDGDGLIDITISDPEAAELIFYRQRKKLGLAEPVKFPAFADTVTLSAADIDRDGKAEVVSLSIKEKVIGVSRFKNDRLSFPQPLELSGEPAAMALADMDLNSKIDCVYVSSADDIWSLRVIYDVGISGGGKNDTHLAELDKLSANPDGLKILDVDQDGLEDVLIFVKYESPILVRQTGKGVFEVIDSPKAQASLIKDASVSSIALANVDGKRGKEMLLAQKNFARSLVFDKGQNWKVIDQYNAKSTENVISAVAVFQLDKADSKKGPAIVLLDGRKGQLQILKPGDDNTYRFEKQLDVGKWNNAKNLKCLQGRFTGSKQKSILLFDSEKFALIIQPGKSKFAKHLEQQFSYETKIKDGIYANLTAGDINSDGKSDIVMVEYNRSHFEILALSAQNNPLAAMRWKIVEQKAYRDSKSGKASVEPREISIAEVTGDGKNDLVTVIHDRIIIYPQD